MKEGCITELSEKSEKSNYTIQQRSHEDISFYISLDCVDYYLICDGHGGKDRLNSGHVAYTLVYGYKDLPPIYRELQSAFEGHLDNSEKIKEIISNVFSKYDQKMYELNCYAGSCICISIVIKKKDIYLVNLGDSRGCIWNQRGILIETRDHGIENLEEIKRIQKAGGFVLYGRLYGNISTFRAFGNWELKCENGKLKIDGALTCLPEIEHITISEDDKVSCVLTSDSFRDIQLHPFELVNIINKCENKHNLAKNIAEIVKNSPKNGRTLVTTDDISILYIEDLTR